MVASLTRVKARVNPKQGTKGAATVELPGRTIHIVSMYPIYEWELELIDRIGPFAFWHPDGYDPYSVQSARSLEQVVIKRGHP